MLHIPALWYFDIPVIYPHRFHRVEFVIKPPWIVWQQYLWNIALQPSVGCYNVWANLHYSGCSPSGEKNHCETGLIKWVSDALINSLPPVRCGYDFKCINQFQPHSGNWFLEYSSRHCPGMNAGVVDGKSTLVRLTHRGQDKMAAVSNAFFLKWKYMNFK